MEMTKRNGFDPLTGAWNDSLTGDFLWSRNNYGEARPDVMTPLTWSVSKTFYEENAFLPGYSMAGNICGRFYANISVMVSMLLAIGKDMESALSDLSGLLGKVPSGIDVPVIPLARSTLLRAMPRMIGLGIKENRGGKKVPTFLATNPSWCHHLEQCFLETSDGGSLLSLWQTEFLPYFQDMIWIVGGGYKPFEDSLKLKHKLAELVGEIDANALLSNLSTEEELMASMGPVVGVSKVMHGEMSREEYIRRYGHRGPREMELSAPRPAEDPTWLDQQIEEFSKSPVDVDALLIDRRAEFDAAWQRFEKRFPRQAQKMQRRVEAVGPAARMREEVRSETTRIYGTVRAWAIRAGELTGMGNGVFFLYLDELLALLSGDDVATQYISTRQETHSRYEALPPYPMIIRGRFDPFEWIADSNRRYDIYDSTAAMPISTSNTINGFAGAAGRVEGLVRVLDGPEQGDQLQPGEILVAVTTNVGWTPLFPRAAAVVTDVGAPLSHAAIVARELGIPAVVGCGSATTLLHNGNRVLVDGGRGIVEILESS
jgi:phosphohistidine swiveling domain-containing protein